MDLSHAIELVRSFHIRAEHPVATSVQPIPQGRRTIRSGWLEEEVAEFLEARDLTDQVDALVDLLYFLLGCAVEMGLSDLSRELEIVHSANMAKLENPSDRLARGRDGKIQKPRGWVDPRPEMAAALTRLACNRRLVTAGPFQCVAASLAMAADGLGHNVELEDLLDLLPPPRTDGDPRLQGVTVTAALIERVMARLGIHVEVTRVPASHIGEMNVLAELVRACERGEVLVGVDMSRLEPSREAFGHLLVLDGVLGDRVRVLDPGPASEGTRVFHVDDLYPAIVARADGGLWIIEEVSR